jgi:hypothetical protein
MRFQPGFRYGASTAVIGALALLAGEANGFAIDATTADGGTVAVIDTGTPANNLSNVILDASNLVQFGTSPKMVHHLSSPYVRWSAHNMFLNSGAPATQNVTLVVGFVYTVTVTGAGGGSITGSAGASGVATTGSPATFTATTTTGTFTYAATLTTIQLNRGAVATPYLATTGAIRIGIPQSYDAAAAKYGILAEPAGTNLILSSEDITTTWVGAGAQTANYATAPDGSTTADRLVASGGSCYVEQQITITSGVICTGSTHVKLNANAQWVRLNLYDGGSNGCRAWFDVTNGVVGTQAAFGSGWTAVSYTITSIGNGWYRVTNTVDTTGTTCWMSIVAADADASTTHDSDADILLWGAQAEEGSVATSYTPTLGSTVTRAADNITAVATSFPLGTSHTAYISAKAREVATQHDVLMLDANNANEDESVRLYTDASANILMQIEDGGATQLAPLDSAVNAAANTAFQITGAWATNDVDVSADGAAAASDGTATMPTLTHLRLGNNPTPGNHLNGFIYKMVYVPRQVETDAGNLETWRYVA